MLFSPFDFKMFYLSSALATVTEAFFDAGYFDSALQRSAFSVSQ